MNETAAARLGFEAGVAGEASRARGEQDEAWRDTSNSKMSTGRPELLLASTRTGWSGDVGVEIRVKLDVLGLDASRRDRIDSDRSFGRRTPARSGRRSRVRETAILPKNRTRRRYEYLWSSFDAVEARDRSNRSNLDRLQCP